MVISITNPPLGLIKAEAKQRIRKAKQKSLIEAQTDSDKILTEIRDLRLQFKEMTTFIKIITAIFDTGVAAELVESAQRNNALRREWEDKYNRIKADFKQHLDKIQHEEDMIDPTR